MSYNYLLNYNKFDGVSILALKGRYIMVAILMSRPFRANIHYL